jgi:hypothetical protein
MRIQIRLAASAIALSSAFHERSRLWNSRSGLMMYLRTISSIIEPMKDKKTKASDTVKTTIVLPRELWRTVKVKALDEGSDLNRIVIAALEAHVRQKGK